MVRFHQGVFMRTKVIDINFIKEGASVEDIDLFLGPFGDENEQNIFFGEDKIMAHLIAFAGVFPSVGQARKNGWNKEIPKGFSEFVIGKNKTKITVLNIMS